MLNWMQENILWLKAFHLIAMVTWFAALFYLPRLFVYHTGVNDAAGNERFKIMERKLLKAIANPGAVVTIVLGVLMILAYGGDYFRQAHWLHLKLVFVLILIGFHLFCWHLCTAFAKDANRHTEKFYRVINEIPVIPLIAIIVLAVVRPI